MRSRGLSTQLAQLKEQLGEIAGPLVELNAEKVDDMILLYVPKQLDRFLKARLMLGIAQCHGVLELGVITLRIDHAELEAALLNSLEKPGRDCRFTPAPH